MFDSDGNPVLKNDTADGWTVTVAVNPDGTMAATNLSSETTLSPTPEPGSIALSGTGLLAILFVMRERLRPGPAVGFPSIWNNTYHFFELGLVCLSDEMLTDDPVFKRPWFRGEAQ
jgi:hypothetical protein